MPLQHQPLAGKCAIVTGASRGIGKAIALELANRGADVVITYVSKASGAEDTVSALWKQGVKAVAVYADAHSAETASHTVVQAAKSLADGHIDIIVNNAADGSDQDLEHTDTAVFDRIMHANVLFPMLLVKTSRPYFRKGTRVVNVSSTGARSGIPFAIVYGASKAALESVTRSMAWDLGRQYEGTANAVNPGPVSTDMWNTTEVSNLADVEKGVMARTPAGDRIGVVDDIAPIVAFLCDPSSRWITANVTCANGGLVMI